jgi:hypothetical protein
MEIKLPKTNQEYKGLLKDYWEVDIGRLDTKGIRKT